MALEARASVVAVASPALTVETFSGRPRPAPLKTEDEKSLPTVAEDGEGKVG